MTEDNPLPDDELELEPVDPEMLAHERQRADEKTRQAEASFDIDEVYREEESADPVSWDELRSFRFTTRHLLIVTALLAVVATTLKRGGGCLGTLFIGVAALAAGWFFVLKKERQARLQRQQLREEKSQRIAAGHDEAVAAGHVPAESPAPSPATPDEPAFKFSFSMKEMLGAMTAAAVTLAMVRLIGGPDNAAMLLGLVALVGLVVHLLGLDPPPIVILGWWLLLVLYIVVSIWAALTPASVAWAEGSSGLLQIVALAL